MRASTIYRTSILSLLSVLLLALISPAFGITPDTYLVEDTILKPPDLNWNWSDSFGNSVDLDGDYAVVGDYSYRFSDSYPDLWGAGIAHIFSKESGNWQHHALIAAPEPAGEDNFGYAVSISGNTIAVSIPYKDLEEADNRGAVFIFERSGTTWSRVARLTTSDGQLQDKIGISLSLEGDTLAVGAPYADIDGVHNQGAVYMYIKPDTGWTDMTETARMTASDGAEDDWFGHAIALNGEWLVVGAPFDSAYGTNPSGAAYLYKMSSEGWVSSTENEKLLSPESISNENFGFVLDLKDGIMVIGGWNRNFNAVWVFRLTHGSWLYEVKLIPPSGIVDEDFGKSIAVGVNTVLIGSTAYDMGILESGHAHMYLFGISGWEYDSTLAPSDGNSLFGDAFGWSAATDGTSTIVGAKEAGIGSKGQAYIYAPLAAVIVSPVDLELEEGGPAGTYTMRLFNQPTGNVIITPGHDTQLSISPSTLVFTVANWSTPQTVTVTAIQDDQAEGYHRSKIAHNSDSEDTRYQGLWISSVTVTIPESYDLYLALNMK